MNQGGNVYSYVANQPTTTIDPFGLARMPEVDVDTCFLNCLSDYQMDTVKVGIRACKSRAWTAVPVAIGTGITGLAVGATKGASIPLDMLFLGFVVYDVYEIDMIMRTMERMKNEARLAYARCVADCANKYGAWDEAHQFWSEQGVSAPQHAAD